MILKNISKSCAIAMILSAPALAVGGSGSAPFVDDAVAHVTVTHPTFTAIAADGSTVGGHACIPQIMSSITCVLPAGTTSKAMRHKTVNELWYVTGGQGFFWREDSGKSLVALSQGISLSIPQGTAFQFQATGDEPLTFFIATFPHWPGDDSEAEPVEGHWPAGAQ